MKKFFAKILSCALAAVLALFVLNGCALITTNTERDMAQVIATVSVDEALSEDVYKRELVSAFNSEGYYYVQYQGMTETEVYEQLLEDIVRNRILKQQAKLALSGATSINEVGYFAQANAISDGDKTSYEHVLSGNNYSGKAFNSVTKTDGVDQFMTEYEYYAIQYNVLSSIKTLIDGYSDDEEEHNHDGYETFNGEVRATLPTESAKNGNEWEMLHDDEIKVVDKTSDFYKSFEQINKEAELGLDLSTYQTNYELSLAVYKAYCAKYDLLIKDSRTEINKVVRDLKKLGFITSEEASKKTPMTKEEILSLTYFADALSIQYDNQLINKYKNALQNEQEKALASDDALYAAYVNVFNSQKNKFDRDYTTYETALENASDSNLVLYNPSYSEGSYGYVLNLLIGFNDEQTAILTAVDESPKLTTAQREQARKDLLATLTAKDLRSSWVESNYGTYDSETNVFTFGDAYCKTEALKTYAGNIYGASEYEYHNDYDIEETAYSYEYVDGREIPFETFYTSVVSSIMGFNGKSGKIDNCTDDDIVKFRDLIFAYSTDPGSLSDNDGYVYSPKTSAKTYVKEFAAAAKEVVNKGVGAYTVVATDFGYHIILCTRVIAPNVTAISKPDFLAQVSQEETIPYLFKEYQKARLVSNNVEKVTNKFFKDNLAGSVTYNEKAYEDLVKEDK